MATTTRWFDTPHDLSRDAMVQLLERRGIRDPCVLAAMASVPRELFVPSSEVDHAYADRPLEIGSDQTISQPFVVAVMIEALELEPDDRVLEIGTGSGYTAAVLSQLAAHVYSVERIPQLAHDARERLAALGYEWIDIRCGDGSIGWPEHAPFEAIIVHAAAPDIPGALIDQLALGGRLVLPIGRGAIQRLVRATKHGKASTQLEDLGPVTFVPLVGAQGWPEDA